MKQLIDIWLMLVCCWCFVLCGSFRWTDIRMALVLSSYFKLFVFAMMVHDPSILCAIKVKVSTTWCIFFVCLLPKCVPFRASFNSCWYIDCVFHLLWVERAQVWEFSPLMAFIIDMLVLSSNTVAIKGASSLLFLIALPWWLVPSLSLSQCIAS